MYDEDLVKEIMISTALCVQEMLLDDPNAEQDDLFEFMENNFRQIIRETVLAEKERRESDARGGGLEGE
jgi:hypothetical protein